jgi:hypothetical protein
VIRGAAGPKLVQMRALAALVLTPLATVAFLHVATSVMGDPAPVVTPAATHPPASLVWADRVFTTKAEFRTWLARRDQSYARWVKMHPGASPWEPRAQQPVVPVARETDGWGVRSTLLAVGLALVGVLAVLAVRARDSILDALEGVRERVAAAARPSLSPAVAVAGVKRLEVVQRRSRGRKQAVGEVPGRTFAEFEATVATMLQQPEAEAVEIVEEPVVRLVPVPPPVEPAPIREPVEELPVEAAPLPPPPPPAQPKVVPKAKPRTAEPPPAPERVEAPPPPEPAPEPEAAALPQPTPPKKSRVAKAGTRRRTTRPPSPKTHAFCEITYSRGYIKGQFWARLWDVEGNPTVAKSELFASRSELPERTAEAEDALEGLARQLVDAGWEPHDDGRTWYGRWFVSPRASGPPGLDDAG